MNSTNPTTRPKIVVVGVPYDDNSSFMRGTAAAPPAIRKAFHSDSSNMCAEDGLDLTDHPHIHDMGDVNPAGGSGASCAMAYIEKYYSGLLEKGFHVISLGGDHAITLPIIRAYAEKYAALTILQLDAHPDLYDELDGNPYSHACPFARIMEENLVDHLMQVGIRTTNPHQQDQANRFQVEVIDMKAMDAGAKIHVSGDVYISLDLDVLDPAFAPGVSHHEPGGMSTREVLRIIQGVEGHIVGADIVEMNPTRDLNGVTAMVAAKFLKEIIGKMLK
jgi:agmatinase